MTPRRAEDLYIYTLIFVFYRGEKVHDTPKERQMCGMMRRSFDLFWEVGKLKVATTYLTKRLQKPLFLLMMPMKKVKCGMNFDVVSL